MTADVQARGRAWTLKACVFATGLAGIVAEYVMATLASYLLGDAVLHWALVISVMLFAMGLGSRLSSRIRGELADAFVAVELALSALVALSAPLVYLLAAWIEPVGLVIYSLALAIGVLIGMEIPLATRLNEAYEELRFNVAAVIEKDYYGALLGGVIFAFVALPYLGLTYTPIALGAVNFAVAAVFYLRFREVFVRRRTLGLAAVLTPVFLVALAALAEPIVRFGEQGRYRDRVVFSQQTRFQRIVLTRWRDDHWLYLDGKEQFSSYDEERYHEPLVHPAMGLAIARRRVLLLGAGDGLAAREVLKYPDVEVITLVELDPAMTELARTHPVLLELNREALDDPRVEIVHADAYAHLLASREVYDVIIVDLPDPRTVALARLYGRQFYELAARHLTPGGVLVTQATSPFFARRAFLSILATVRAAGLVAVPYHNHVPTLGLGWVLGVRVGAGGASGAALDGAAVRSRLAALDVEAVATRFLNRDAMLGMLQFGKGILDGGRGVEVSEEANLAVFYYYRDGDWDLYSKAAGRRSRQPPGVSIRPMPDRRKPPLWVQRLYRFLRRENLHRVLLFLFLLSFLSAVSLWRLEPETPLRDWVWWAIVTMTTVGYGDITPASTLGRLIGVVLMVCGIGVLSIFTATIASFFLEIKLRSQSGMDQLQLKDHFILCEWNQRAREILRELRSDRRAQAPVVLLADIDSKPVDDDNLFFIRGDVTEDNLERANVDTAATVIILGDDDLDPSSRDAKVVLSTLTVETMNRDAYTIVELVREENARHCRRAHADEIIVGNEFSSRLIASAAVDHGISKVLSEILSTRGGSELQKVPLAADQAGRPFLEVFSEMKREKRSTVVAVQRGGEVRTNPDPDLALEAADQLIVIADPGG